jgi:hypothetical protein
MEEERREIEVIKSALDEKIRKGTIERGIKRKGNVESRERQKKIIIKKK